MSQSDSEGDADIGSTESKPLYAYHTYYHDAADKARIDAMTQIDREVVLAERAEELQRHEQDESLRRLIAAREKESARRNKRNAEAAELDEGQRKSSRQRTKLGGGRAGEASSSIEAYKKQREERKLQGENRKAAPARRMSPIDDDSDGDAEAESDNDYYQSRSRRRSPTPVKDDPPAELADVQKARIGRDNFAQVCYTPGFDDAVTGCYVRVNLGPGPTPGVNVYRLCSIKAIATGRPYAMTAPDNNRPFLTDKYIIAAHGKAEKQWSFIECSMGRFTDDEWRHWRATLANENGRMPTKGQISKKLEGLDKLIKFKWTGPTIDARIAAQKALADKVSRVDEKEAILDKIAVAREMGNSKEVADLEDQLLNIVPMKLALGTSMGPKIEVKQVNKEEDRLAALNRRNQQLNNENIRKAQLAEMHARKAKKHLAPGVDELFEGGSDISRSGTPVNGQGTPKLGPMISRGGTPVPFHHLNGASKNGTPRAGTPVSSLGKPAGEKRKGLPTIRKAVRDDDILAGMDLGIDIDI
jgi:RNA polymerase-associated protein RTF1